jgi:hypothetical protein
METIHLACTSQFSVLILRARLTAALLITVRRTAIDCAPNDVAQ